MNLVPLSFSLSSDPDLADQCLTDCRLKYVDCQWGCDSAYCSEQCGKRFEVCNDGCPCGADCPGGCAGCENPICPEEVLPINLKLKYVRRKSKLQF